ncbi:sigma-70 family RNA polymerase sigma factor [Paenibacillus sp. ACRRX]|uniref:RNA polymerase sigma factor n=1 Tax=unclassified Paenibacillus TaxID=185978 RepID=UPI001EF62C9F|nr:MULTISPECIES: sigma-70 family RNA polymerase sigma factor [unclassified Paenibacillus]MCG7408290.1 sigma-70 family RNA polymerase sigma factor [Paenibacillus sp. ACRRX]MDK8181325.1 sigma-70 family RNA polymerase sigma factor [Paenibacillus sp. UMB4589-SE434]
MERWLLFLRDNIHHLDSSTQQSVYYSYKKLIYRDIYLLFHNHELAEDVVQESFLKVMMKAPKLRHSNNLKAWVKKVARNTAYDYLKKNQKYYLLSHSRLIRYLEHHSQADVVLVDSHIESKICYEMLYESLDQLNTRYQDVIRLYYLENKTCRVIANELEMSEQALIQLLYRARKKLYTHFSRKWGMRLK